MHARFGERVLETSGSNAVRRQRSTLLRCESILLNTHWVLVVIDRFTRRIIGFGVHAGDVDGLALFQMFNTAISAQNVSHYLSCDNDPLFLHHRWQANLRILDIQAIKSVPYMPLSHPFVERLIETIRREYLDQMLFWNASDLKRKMVAIRESITTRIVYILHSAAIHPQKSPARP